MEKVINLKMCNDQSIKIYLDDQEKHIIDVQSRSIDAEKLYNVFDFTPGDTYIVLSENESDIDIQVLEFFTELFSDIADKVNAISTNIVTPE
ncbi:MAG: hypothetical protein WCY49_01935 [Anaerovoracaceae bacterium]